MNATVGPYTLGDSLGMLPFGEFVEATHTARTEPLAALLLDERLAKDTRFRGLLRLENARAGGLRHPALARTIEIVQAGDTLAMVIERPPICLMLAHGLEAGGPLTAEDVMGTVRQVAEGLDAAHARRLVHGAIDPSFVLVGSDGAVKLAGIGVLAAAEDAGLVDVVIERRGTAFVAPEQRTGPRIVASADAYALGVLAATLIREHVDPPAPTAGLTAVLDRQTSDDPSARYPTCAAFASALAEAITPSTAPTPPTAPDAPSLAERPVTPTVPAPAEPARSSTPPARPAPYSADAAAVALGSRRPRSPHQKSPLHPNPRRPTTSRPRDPPRLARQPGQPCHRPADSMSGSAT